MTPLGENATSGRMTAQRGTVEPPGPPPILPGMRLSIAQRLALRQRVADELGPHCEIRVFGSRVDDQARGGDVDLLVQCPRRLNRKVWLAARLGASAERVLERRKVDVLLVDPDTLLQPVHRAAMREGVVL